MNFRSKQYITKSNGFSLPLSRVLGHPHIGVLEWSCRRRSVVSAIHLAGAIRQSGFINTDFSVNKRFRIGESRSFEFRAEIFNLFNHFNPDPQTVDLNLQSLTFGSIGGGEQGVTTRIIKLGAKFYF